MSGIVSFIIKGQDALSAPLTKVSNSSTIAKGALGKLTESNKQLKTMMGESRKSVNQLKERIDQLQKQRDLIPSSSINSIKAINKEINKLNTDMQRLQTSGGSKMKTWAKDAFGSLPDLIKNPLVLAGAGLAAVVNQGMKDARGKLDFGLLVGDKQAGAQIYGKLKKSNALTGGQGVESGKALLNSGFSGDKVADTVERLGAVSMGDAGKMQALTGAFAQVNKEGKLTDATLQMMNDAGLKPLSILAEKSGVSLKEMQKRLEDGKISIGDVTDALAVATNKGGAFGNVLNEMKKDPGVMWDTLVDKVMGFAGALGTSLMPIVTGVLEYAAIGFDYLATAIGWVSEAVGSVIGYLSQYKDILIAVVAAIGAGIVAYKVYQGVQALSVMWAQRGVIADTAMVVIKGALALATGGAATAMGFLNAVFWASPIGWIVGGIGALVGIVVLAWNKFEGFRKAVMGVWEVIKNLGTIIKDYVINRFKDLLSGITGIGSAFSKLFDGDFKGAWEEGSKAIANLTGINAEKKADSVIYDSYAKGAAKGAASWQASQAEKNKKATTATDDMFANNGKPLDFKSEVPGKADAKTDDKLNAVSGGGAKTINVTVHKMIESLTQYVNGGTEAAAGVETELEMALARVFQSLR